MKIYVAVVEALRKKERGDETQFTTKIGGKTNLDPSYFGFVKFHSQLHICNKCAAVPLWLARLKDLLFFGILCN